MNALEKLIAVIAPHHCLACSKEGLLLCGACSETELQPIPSRCYRCHKASSQHKVCENCKRKVKLSHVWIAAEYSFVARELVHKLKFERAQNAAGVIAGILDENLPILPEGTIVMHVPTTDSRVRERGYDQARLISKSLAQKRDLTYRDGLIRLSNTRQVGSSRKDRFAQLAGAFEVDRPKALRGQRILLVDDVLTTGATLESASRKLKEAGARTIDAVVFAH